MLGLLATGWVSAAAIAGRGGGKAAAATTASSPTSLATEAPTTSAPTASVTTTVPTTTAAPTTVPVTAPPTSAPPTSAPPTTAPAPPPPAPAVSSPPPNCGVGQGTFRPASEAEFRSLMTGAWVLCQSPSVFGTTEAGMELRPDGRWSKLERRPDGALALAAGWGNEGRWTTTDTSSMNGQNSYQINLYVDGEGGFMSNPTFGQGSTSAGITRVRLVEMMHTADYVRAPADARILPPPPAGTGQGCATREEPFAPSTEAQFRTLITGAWLLCSPRSVFGTSEAGLEILADGRWFKLNRTDHGALVRATDPADRGTWQSIDVSAMNGRPTFQLNLALESGGIRTTLPVFGGTAGAVSKIRLGGDSSLWADYIPAV